MTKGQSKRGSAVESLAGTIVGFGVAVGTQALIFPWFGLQVTAPATLGLAAIFTVISLIRGYCLRRVFNWFHTKTGA